MYKIVFDTNSIRSDSSLDKYLGGRIELEKFLQHGKIVIPDIVIEELERQKIRKFITDKQKFFETIISKIIPVDEKKISNDSFELRIKELKNNESISYTQIGISDPKVLFKMKDLAINKQAPFEATNGNDKGFKDVYIYFTVLEYIGSLDNEIVYVVTKDKKLTEAFVRHPNIIPIIDYDDFRKKSIIQFKDDYFIEKLNTELNLEVDITKENIKDFWVNLNGNYLIKIEVDDHVYITEVDAGEIIFTINHSDYSDLILKLITSNDFGNTFTIVHQLKNYINYLNNYEIIKLFEALVSNSQIKGAFHNAVKDFYTELYENKKEFLSDELKEKVEKII